MDAFSRTMNASAAPVTNQVKSNGGRLVGGDETAG
jgi:hypothetical protein